MKSRRCRLRISLDATVKLSFDSKKTPAKRENSHGNQIFSFAVEEKRCKLTCSQALLVKGFGLRASFGNGHGSGETSKSIGFNRRGTLGLEDVDTRCKTRLFNTFGLDGSDDSSIISEGEGLHLSFK
jgi:hypothetical protein